MNHSLSARTIISIFGALLVAILVTVLQPTQTFASASGGQVDFTKSVQAPANNPTFGNCTYTQGYWKNHAEAWPVSTLTLGNTSYNKSQLLGIFNFAEG